LRLIDLDVPENGIANINAFKLAFVKTFLNLLTPNKGLEGPFLGGAAKTASRLRLASWADERLLEATLKDRAERSRLKDLFDGDLMREVLLELREDKSHVYFPDKCIGCATCVAACPKGELVIGSVGAVARGLIDKDFIQKRSEACVFCGMCAKACPTGALAVRKEENGSTKKGPEEKEEVESYLSKAIGSTTVDDKCVHCGLCAEVCPQGCINVIDRKLAQDGSLKVEGKTVIDQEACVHCGWCEAICPVDAIAVSKPFSGTFFRDEDVCMACRTCVDTCPCNALFNQEFGPGEIVEKVTHRADACIFCGACSVACPVGAITVEKTAILPEMKKKGLEKRILVKTARPTLTSVLKTNRDACLGCGNCVIVCPVNALADPYLAAGHLNELENKPLLEVENGAIMVVDQDVCGSCATCSLICPTEAIWLERREVI
jgi:4Fe-4S ferredoxin